MQSRFFLYVTLVLALVLSVERPGKTQPQVQSPTFSSEFEMKIVSGQFFVRRKGTSDWKPSVTFDETIEVGSFDGNHKIYLASKTITGPKAKHTEPPDFPRDSKPSNSRVLLHAIVDEQGVVRFAYADVSPSPEFTQEAFKAVKKWTFEPAKLSGQPVAVLIIVEMNFYTSR